MSVTQLAPKLREFSEMTQYNDHCTVQGHSRSPISVPVKSHYATSC